MTVKTTASILLALKERIPFNPSSKQISDTLDDILFRAVKPILFNTYHVEKTLAEILSFVCVNNRRKISNLSQQNLVDALYTIIIAADNNVKLKILQSIRLERSIYFAILSSFEKISETYFKAFYGLLNSPSAENKAICEQAIEQIDNYFGKKTSLPLFYTFRRSKYWHESASTFKGMVVEKFVKLAYNESKKAASNTRLDIDSNDIFKNYVLSISKAIDKYDPDKGTLTQYIKWWFMDAGLSSNNSHEYGVAYKVPTQIRKALLSSNRGFTNFNSILDDENFANTSEPSVLDNLIDVETKKSIIRLCMHADVEGDVCLVMGLEYPLSGKERQILSDTMLS